VGTAVTIGLFFAVLAIGFAVVTALHVLLAFCGRAERPPAASLPPRQADSLPVDSVALVRVSCPISHQKLSSHPLKRI
jgi:hypothetical protein